MKKESVALSDAIKTLKYLNFSMQVGFGEKRVLHGKAKTKVLLPQQKLELSILRGIIQRIEVV